MIDAVLFDLGDTIIDFGVGRREAEVLFRQGAKLTYQDLLARNTPNLPPYHVYFKTHYRIMQRAYIWSKLSRRDFSYETVQQRAAYKLGLNLSPEDLRRLAILWYHPIALASTIDPGVCPMLREMRDSGLNMGIVSNTIVPPTAWMRTWPRKACWSFSRSGFIRQRCDIASRTREFSRSR